MSKRERSARRGLPILVTATILFLSGCGGSGKYPVEGQVIFEENGSPVKNVRVVCEPKDPEAPRVSALGITNDEGFFVLTTDKDGDGAIEGVQKVLIDSPPPPEENELNPLPPLVDSKYRRFETSGLEYTVTRDKNTWVIKVHKPRPRP